MKTKKKRVFKEIANDHIPIWVKVLSEETNDANEILKEMKLIDDLLVLQKTQSLLRRKKGLKDLMMDRIGFEIGIDQFGKKIKTTNF